MNKIVKNKIVSPTKPNEEEKEQTALQRLREQKREAEDNNNSKMLGAQSGRDFALEGAEYSELMRLRKWWNVDYSGGPADVTLEEIENALGMDCGGVEWILEHCRDFVDNPVWLNAFVDSAVQKFKELESKLAAD